MSALRAEVATEPESEKCQRKRTQTWTPVSALKYLSVGQPPAPAYKACAYSCQPPLSEKQKPI
eukprot:467464-Rhodomonas_salina.1